MKRSVILTDRLGPDILLVLTMKRQVLHRERAHLKVPGCSGCWKLLQAGHEIKKERYK